MASKKSVVPFGPQHPVLPEPIHLDLVLEELAQGNEAEQQSARQIKEKIHRYALEDLQKSGQFNVKI